MVETPKRSKSREGVREGLAWWSGEVQGLHGPQGRWSVGWRGVPTGAGLVDGGVDQGLDSRWTGVREAGQGLGGGCKGFGSGG